MSGITDLDILLSSMKPHLHSEDYVFCTFANTSIIDTLSLNPLCSFQEEEGLTLIIRKTIADMNRIEYASIFSQITLTVHSSLDAVGLTATISSKLTDNNISANVIAAFYHDHIFVPKDKSLVAISCLNEL